ncbi:helix-turn-helix domain-containing protein [Chryseobacterium sp. SIMBA_029]|uniref:helix-turn-helix domain-containing protein n=1 Tax=Chryseobacterium sp. SIMBA_029 TaxID=3085772 RepID=UPI0039796D00
MKIKFYKPKNSILKKYIKGYYFILQDETGQSLKYWTFPNNYCIISVSLNTDVLLEENKMTIIPSDQTNVSADLVWRYASPVEIFYEKPVTEITIYFKPLGLNHFIRDFSTILRQKNIIEFDAFHDFKTEMEKILNYKKRKIQIRELENYWLSKLLDKNLSLMDEIMRDVESDHMISDIAEKHHISRGYLNKLFLKYLGKSPSEYRKIHRFRNSVATKKHAKNLTELSYDNMFYDQSHFIKNFKNLTTLNPNAFFKQVNTHKNNIWLFI